MKRSEAIDKIAQFLQDNHKDLIHMAEDGHGDFSLYASKLLNMIEEDIEMNPPYDSSSDDENPQYNWQNE